MKRAVALASAALVLVGCGGQGRAQDRPTELTVYAAASLTATFTQIGDAYEAAQDDVSVRFNFAGSADLLGQLGQGAPADVLATADTPTMAKAQQQDLVAGQPAPFATNTMQIAVPPENPAHISSLAEAVLPGVRLVVCAPAVPCGAAAEQVVANAGLSMTPVSEESSVTGVLGKVISGEADAGFVYRTDVKGAAGGVVGVEIPDGVNVVNRYPIALTKGGSLEAQSFIDFVLGPSGQAILGQAGFGHP